MNAPYARYLHSKTTTMDLESEHSVLDPYEEGESPLVRIEEYIGEHGLNRKDFYKHTHHFTKDQSDHMIRHGLALESRVSQVQKLKERHLEPLHISVVRIHGRSQRVYRDRRGRFASLRVPEQGIGEKMVPKNLQKSEETEQGKESRERWRQDSA